MARVVLIFTNMLAGSFFTRPALNMVSVLFCKLAFVADDIEVFNPSIGLVLMSGSLVVLFE